MTPVPSAPLGPNDVHYPARLRAMPRPPAQVWVAGRAPNDGERLVAVVGSRSATGAGCQVAAGFGAGLVGAGYAVVSGGAFGIDAAAHEGALGVGGDTFAVLGCGVDIAYPDRHAALFARIRAHGGLLSEHAPGTPPKAGHFPARNRLIVALSEAVVVVEAAPRSGALITARLAKKNGTRLFALPGSAGTDDLIATGDAVAVRSMDDLRAALRGQAPLAVADVHHGLDDARSVSPTMNVVMAALGARVDSAAGVALRTGLPIKNVMAALTEAELEGNVRRRPGGIYEVRRGH